MYVYGSRSGSGRVFPHQTTVGWRLRAEFPAVGCTVTTVTISITAIIHRPVLVVQAVTVAVVVVMVMMMVMVVLVMVTAAVRPLEVICRRQRTAHRGGGQLPALERRRPIARGFTVVHGRVATDATAARTSPAVGGKVPTAHPHAPRKEQLEEQPLELLTEYHVDDEVDRRVDRHQEVTDFDQMVDGDAVERLNHVSYERPHVALEEHDHHAQQHGGQPDLPFLQT